MKNKWSICVSFQNNAYDMKAYLEDCKYSIKNPSKYTLNTIKRATLRLATCTATGNRSGHSFLTMFNEKGEMVQEIHGQLKPYRHKAQQKLPNAPKKIRRICHKALCKLTTASTKVAQSLNASELHNRILDKAGLTHFPTKLSVVFSDETWYASPNSFHITLTEKEKDKIQEKWDIIKTGAQEINRSDITYMDFFLDNKTKKLSGQNCNSATAYLLKSIGYSFDELDQPVPIGAHNDLSCLIQEPG